VLEGGLVGEGGANGHTLPVDGEDALDLTVAGDTGDGRINIGILNRCEGTRREPISTWCPQTFSHKYIHRWPW
jgi:hypothetical protein